MLLLKAQCPALGGCDLGRRLEGCQQHERLQAELLGRMLRARLQRDVSLRKERLGALGGGKKLRLETRATAVQPLSIPSPAPSVDWDNLGFSLKPTDVMYVMKGDAACEWQQGELLPFGNLELSPSAGVLNYGQGVFEGLKAYRTEDGRILLFRPHENASRMQVSADRLSMPAPSVDAFVTAVKQTVAANARWVPPAGRGSLYVRPLLIGSGPILGLGPAPEYSFIVYCSPVGNYFKGGLLTPIQLVVEEHFHRAAPGGTGGVKCVGNYSPVLKTQLAAKAQGYADVLYLDAVENKYVEEVSSCNIFIIKNGVISTPALHGTILPGITRKSIIELARSLGYEVNERLVSIDDVLSADEVFCTGTAVVVSPVGSLTFRGARTEFSEPNVSQSLYTALTNLQTGKAPDTMGWTAEVI